MKKRKQSQLEDDAEAYSVLQFYSKSKDADDLPSLGIADWRKRLSNFWACEIDVGGKRYPSVEHAFHALKALHCSDKPEMAVSFECGGRVGSNPQNAKTAGGKGAYKKVGAKLDLAKWDAQRDDATMIALRARVACDAEFCAILRATAGQYLLHFERQAAKAYWGGAVSASTGEVVGRNRLGEMLMELRDELLEVRGEEQASVEASSCAAARGSVAASSSVEEGEASCGGAADAAATAKEEAGSAS